MNIDVRLAAAIQTGKVVMALTRRLGTGGGTALPGEVARRIDPQTLAKLSRQLSDGAIVVTGTNGKTTTSRMLSSIIRENGGQPVHNRAGANLLSGVTSALLASANRIGKAGADVGLFEIDEATLPAIVTQVCPRVVVITNLFRDQLDRYGEIDLLARRWRAALDRLGPEATIVLNADDPLVASLGQKRQSRVVYFGIDDDRLLRQQVDQAADSKFCPFCHALLNYDGTFYGHLGHYHCPRCTFSRPTPVVAATTIDLLGTEGLRATMRVGETALTVAIGLPGVYNAYNLLAATAAALAVDIAPAAIERGLAQTRSAFGRVERISVGDRTLFIALVKNPIGFNQVIETIGRDSSARAMVILINDQLADGTDVSWLWDVDVEILANRADQRIVVGGTRGPDMALRLKYAGLNPSTVGLGTSLADAVDQGLAAIGPGETLYVLPTYTALLELRALLSRRGLVDAFWEN